MSRRPHLRAPFCALLGALLLAACGTNETGQASGGATPVPADAAAGDASGTDPRAPDLDDEPTVTPPSPGDDAGEPPTGPDDAGFPMETLCDDGVDNDRDGQVDCDDTDCWEDPACEGLADSEFNCVDGIDNDGNGLTDCEDPACARSPVCRAPIDDADAGPSDDVTAPPAPGDASPPPDEDVDEEPGDDVSEGPDGGGLIPPIPFEFECSDGLDNDRDGRIDCDDPNCEFIPPCLTGGGPPPPPIPFEFQCDDGIDNDRDGLVDCDDPNCEWIPPCLFDRF